MKKIKVAFFAEILIEDHDGATRTMFQLLKRIPEASFEFLFICGSGPDKVAGFECMKIPSVTLPVNRNYTMSLPLLALPKMIGKLKEFKPDVIHIATPSPLGQYAIQYAQAHRLPVISIYHTHFISYVDYYLKHLPFLIDCVKSKILISMKTFYNQCDQVYIPSESIAAELMAMGIHVNRMKIWKRGIDAGLFSPLKKNARVMREITGNGHPTVLFASRLVWEKNLETLFRIYDRLQISNPEYNFVIAGDGAAGGFCKTRMLKAHCFGTADHEKLSVLYASADVFVFTSVSESYGNVVLEAMASGLPCVIANGGGSKDFIEQGINGFACEPNNEKDYIGKINLLLQNKNLWNQFSEEGRKYSLHFDWNELANTYFNDVAFLSHKYEAKISLS